MVASFAFTLLLTALVGAQTSNHYWHVGGPSNPSAVIYQPGTQSVKVTNDGTSGGCVIVNWTENDKRSHDYTIPAGGSLTLTSASGAPILDLRIRPCPGVEATGNAEF